MKLEVAGATPGPPSTPRKVILRARASMRCSCSRREKVDARHASSKQPATIPARRGLLFRLQHPQAQSRCRLPYLAPSSDPSDEQRGCSSVPSPCTGRQLAPLSPAVSLVVGKRTFDSITCHFSPTRSARTLHISLRTIIYSLASVSNFGPPQSSAFRRSISRSCRLRQAFEVFSGKCSFEIVFQSLPFALAVIRISSSSGVHIEVFRVPASDGNKTGSIRS